MARWLGSSFWWIPLVVVVLIGGVGVYAYRAIEHSTREQLERELGTILEADIQALHLWMENQKAVVRAEASRSDLAEPLLALHQLSRTARDVEGALRGAPR